MGRQGAKQTEAGSSPLQLSFFFKSCSIWTLSCEFWLLLTIIQTLKWLTLLPISLRNHSCGVQYFFYLSRARSSKLLLPRHDSADAEIKFPSVESTDLSKALPFYGPEWLRMLFCMLCLPPGSLPFSFLSFWFI